MMARKVVRPDRVNPFARLSPVMSREGKGSGAVPFKNVFAQVRAARGNTGFFVI